MPETTKDNYVVSVWDMRSAALGKPLDTFTTPVGTWQEIGYWLDNCGYIEVGYWTTIRVERGY